jgi:hippurate hydrolase
VPSAFWYSGGADPAAFKDVDPDALLENGIPPEIPGNHLPLFAPVIDPTVEIGVTSLLAAAAQWLTAGADTAREPLRTTERRQEGTMK